jgi:hypothetical protein
MIYSKEYGKIYQCVHAYRYMYSGTCVKASIIRRF